MIVASSWMDVSRLLRAQGWRHTRAWLTGPRDRDGAPLFEEDILEHTWRRRGADICAYTDPDGAMCGFLNFRDDEGSDEMASVHVKFAEKHGFHWLLDVMVKTGILAEEVAP